MLVGQRVRDHLNGWGEGEKLLGGSVEGSLDGGRVVGREDLEGDLTAGGGGLETSRSISGGPRVRWKVRKQMKKGIGAGTDSRELKRAINFSEVVDSEGDVGGEDEVVREGDGGGEDAVVDLWSWKRKGSGSGSELGR